MPNLPKVAVIIANYNQEKYVCNAVKSAYEQTYKGEIIIIVVDDCSTDNSVSVLKELSAPFKLVESNINRGPAAARNTGIFSEIVDFYPDVFISLDADDEFLPTKIEESVNEWLKAPDLIGAVYSDYYIIGNDGYKKEEYKPAFSYRHLLSENIVHSCSLFSRKAIEAVGPYDEQFRYATCEDYDLWLRIGSKFVIKHIPKMLMNVRDTGINSSKITDKNRQIWQDSMKYLKDKHGKKLHS